MLSHYFNDKNYNLLYLHIFGDTIADKLDDYFTAVFLYQIGLSLPFILLFFGLEFGARGIVSLYVPKFIRRTEIGITVSYVFQACFFIFVFLGQWWLVLGFFSFLFKSLGKGIYYPCLDTLYSHYVNETERGRHFSFGLTCGALAAIVALGIGTLVLSQSFLWAGTILGFVFLSAALPLWFLSSRGKETLVYEDEKVEAANEVFSFMRSQGFRENLIPFTGFSFVIVANLVVLPLAIYLSVQSNFSLVLFFGLLIEIGITLIYGALIDLKGHKRTLTLASFLLALTNLGFLAATTGKGALPLSLLNGANNTCWNMYSSNITTRIQQKALKHTAIVFNSAAQTTLCFVEVVLLTGCALLEWILPGSAISLIFLLSIVGLYLSSAYFKD